MVIVGCTAARSARTPGTISHSSFVGPLYQVPVLSILWFRWLPNILLSAMATAGRGASAFTTKHRPWRHWLCTSRKNGLLKYVTGEE